MKIVLSLEELLVMKALAKRTNAQGYAAFRMQSLDAKRVSQLVGGLHRVGLVEAKRTPDGDWLAGPLTQGGRAWLNAYGMTIRD